MLEDRWVNINGSFAAWKDATVHMMSHGFSRGSTIFEVISFHDTRRGVAVFRLEDHIRRLFRSAELLDMELPVSQEDLCEAVAATIGKNGLKGGFVKVLGYYPQVAFEILPPQRRLDVAVFALDSRADLGGFDSAHQEGTTVGIAGWRKLDPQTVPIEAKAAANYLNGMIARAEVRRRGFKDVLMLDTQGFLAEGGTEAYFFVRDGKLLSPALGTVLAGITRRSVLEAAAFMEVETVEGRFRPELVGEAEEIFISSTPFKVLPVRQIEERMLADVPGPVTRRFSEMMQRIVSGEVERFKDWLYPVR
jgi:branched-chain amino acid aminotransferase